MAMKLDMSKVYDQVKCIFLCVAMKKWVLLYKMGGSHYGMCYNSYMLNIGEWSPAGVHQAI